MVVTQKSATPPLRRILFALLFTPLLPPFYATLFFAEPWSLPIGLLLTYPSAWLLGLPIVLLLRRLHRLDGWSLALAGAVCSVPALLLYWWIDTPPHLQAFSAVNALELLGWGAFSGLCFWLLGIVGDSSVSLRTLLDIGPPQK
ncbi:hypothetical protein ELE36_13550 [Pseudolysobacter antarcticus]|uniref:Uncharacterized protein n=1 Tax=Pseudolysobacter antarcticus TaxID=2511995 RepID=A0A411HL90_9GAMM|nr:hypothetical protein [Pseudolysobacter antarcticus]QBB71296.1 hypothetical protein ELE36_13550 [Pseudolysobacter antarcticus]